MEKVDHIRSDNGEHIIDVIRDADGSYILNRFVCKYDIEEEKTYEVRVRPDPIGKFGDIESAVREAKNILDLLEGKDH